MINHIDFKIKELEQMSQYPKNLYYIGNLELLKKKKIGVIGSRHPSQYSINVTQRIVNLLSEANNIIVSGGAIGIDTIAHKSAGYSNTIMICHLQ
ncbi:DNA-processing protein DprA [Aliarcobacter lanthieri]|uniref:DNA-processing protein DprA n=1 Tax=Aliarcobacter lanthieri TaxID=1355374 RepID=UPI00047E4397|nr:DNA-processing protein DprA [Aliarcobacter lanthieri]